MMKNFRKIFSWHGRKVDEKAEANNNSAQRRMTSNKLLGNLLRSKFHLPCIFYKWPDTVSHEPEQLYRIRRAATENISIVSYNYDDRNAVIRGNSGAMYTTSLDGCTCEDYLKRELPCKHMYVLAGYLGRVKLSRIANKNADKIKDFTKNLSPEIVEQESYGAKWEIFDVPQGDNMALRKYEAQYYKERANASIYVYKPKLVTYGDNPEQVFKTMLKEGQHILPGSVREIPYDRPTQAQLYHAIRVDHITIPKYCCKEDLSCLIDREEDLEFKPADPELKQFCKLSRIPYSRYVGENILIEDVFRMLKSDKERIAFQIAVRVYRSRKSWNFQNWDRYLELADGLITENSKFKSSFLNNYMPEPSLHSLIGREIKRVVNESF